VRVSYKRSEKLLKISIGVFTKNTNHRRGRGMVGPIIPQKMLIINISFSDLL